MSALEFKMRLRSARTLAEVQRVAHIDLAQLIVTPAEHLDCLAAAAAREQEILAGADDLRKIAA